MYVSSSDISLSSTLTYPLSYSISPFKYLLHMPKLIWFIKNKSSCIHTLVFPTLSFPLVSKLLWQFFSASAQISLVTSDSFISFAQPIVKSCKIYLWHRGPFLTVFKNYPHSGTIIYFCRQSHTNNITIENLKISAILTKFISCSCSMLKRDSTHYSCGDSRPMETYPHLLLPLLRLLSHSE